MDNGRKFIVTGSIIAFCVSIFLCLIFVILYTSLKLSEPIFISQFIEEGLSEEGARGYYAFLVNFSSYGGIVSFIYFLLEIIGFGLGLSVRGSNREYGIFFITSAFLHLLTFRLLSFTLNVIGGLKILPLQKKEDVMAI